MKLIIKQRLALQILYLGAYLISFPSVEQISSNIILLFICCLLTTKHNLTPYYS